MYEHRNNLSLYVLLQHTLQVEPELFHCDYLNFMSLYADCQWQRLLRWEQHETLYN